MVLAKAYLPEWNFNGIGDFNFLEGYLVKVISDVSLDVISEILLSLKNSPLYLDAGYGQLSLI